QALEGQIVTFMSHGEDPDRDDRIVEYRWDSNIDGFLSDEKIFSTSRLTMGTHQITLRVKDSNGLWSTEVTRNLKVERKTITITPATTISLTPSAKIEDISVDYDVWEGDSYGMRIHVSFTVNNLKDMNGRANAYFFTADGMALNDFNQKYYTTDGKVASWMDFTPSYENSRYDDLTIFMPYSELHMAPGQHNLKFYVSINYKGTSLYKSAWVPFTFTQQ
ncbi:MAG: PKD domain-containing protein, partial [Candidatus Methanoperedens sp.]|nr:PKD domain-containing protein [Candidatus Methanoperedens sp.]